MTTNNNDNNKNKELNTDPKAEFLEIEKALTHVIEDRYKADLRQKDLLINELRLKIKYQDDLIKDQNAELKRRGFTGGI